MKKRYLEHAGFSQSSKYNKRCSTWTIKRRLGLI